MHVLCEKSEVLPAVADSHVPSIYVKTLAVRRGRTPFLLSFIPVSSQQELEVSGERPFAIMDGTSHRR
jgi:hypothetical protein